MTPNGDGQCQPFDRVGVDCYQQDIHERLSLTIEASFRLVGLSIE
jgi:hypothetical protein